MRVFCLLILLVVAGQPAFAKEKWINLQTRNFNVVSNAEEKKVRELALKLEQFRHAFSLIYPDTPPSEPVPLTVVIFRNDGTFKPFKPIYNGKRRDNVGGYFKQGEDENIIVFDSSYEALRIIFHEYTHLLTSYSTIELPAWLSEGLAEVYSTFEIDKSQVTIGSPLATHVQYLRSNDLQLLPLQKLINADRNSDLYNETDKASLFYTQSWAFVHYLMLSEKGMRKPQLFKYIKLLRAGKTPDQAFAEAFGISFDEMERALRYYVTNSNYTIVKYQLPSVIDEKDFMVRPMSEAEALVCLGNLLLRSDRLDEAEGYYRQAAALDAQSTGLAESLGFVAMKRERWAEAVDHFKRAIARGSKNHLVYYQRADAVYRLANTGQQDSISAEAADEMIESLRSVVQLRPEFAPAYHLLALACLSGKKDYQEGVKWAKNAILFAPSKRQYALTLAQLQIRAGDYVGARKTIEPLLNIDDHDLKEAAQLILKVINETKNLNQ